jgi:hypothetical protein
MIEMVPRTRILDQHQQAREDAVDITHRAHEQSTVCQLAAM